MSSRDKSARGTLVHPLWRVQRRRRPRPAGSTCPRSQTVRMASSTYRVGSTEDREPRGGRALWLPLPLVGRDEQACDRSPTFPEPCSALASSSAALDQAGYKTHAHSLDYLGLCQRPADGERRGRVAVEGRGCTQSGEGRPSKEETSKKQRRDLAP